MKISVNEELDTRFKKVLGVSPEGLYISRNNELYLVHLRGVSQILENGGTQTSSFEDFKVPLRKLTHGDRLEIEF